MQCFTNPNSSTNLNRLVKTSTELFGLVADHIKIHCRLYNDFFKLTIDVNLSVEELEEDQQLSTRFSHQ